MDSSLLLLFSAGIFFIIINSNGGAPGMSVNNSIHIPGTTDSDTTAAIIDLYNHLVSAVDPATGQPLSQFQINLITVQDLFETGLWQGTDGTNWNAVDNLNNYGGVMGNSHFSAQTGSALAAYPDLQTGVNDQLRFLNVDFGKGRPLDATSISDYISRLRGNKNNCGYICDSDVANYNANFQNIYNIYFA
jgi:hypothetical protein